MITKSKLQQNENIIKQLYESMTMNCLPDEKAQKPYYLDEFTGTWYVLTGKRQIERPSVEKALKYFIDVFDQYKNSLPNTDGYLKAEYCSIALEAINRMLGNAPTNHKLEGEK